MLAASAIDAHAASSAFMLWPTITAIKGCCIEISSNSGPFLRHHVQMTPPPPATQQDEGSNL